MLDIKRQDGKQDSSFILSGEELRGLIRVAEAIAGRTTHNQDISDSMRAQLGDLAKPTASRRGIECIKRFQNWLADAQIEARDENVLVAFGDESPIPIKETGQAGAVGAAVLEHMRDKVIYFLGKGKEEDESCVEVEIRRYLERHPPAYSLILGEHAGALPRLEPGCRTSICIPVAAHEEGGNIYRTLRCFLNQTAPFESFEIVLFLNHPARDANGRPVNPDHTAREVNRFREENPELRVRSFSRILEPGFAKIGYIRKLLTDVVLLRYFRQGDLAKDHYLIRADADTCGVNPHFVSNYVRQFERHPEADSFQGSLDWDWPSFARDPVLLYGTRLYTICDNYIKIRNREVGGGGANFAVRASRYAAAGGYQPATTLGEDVELGWNLADSRFGSPEHTAIRYAGARSRIWTSCRRSIAAVRAGHAPVCQWSNEDSPFKVDDKSVRCAPPAHGGGKSFCELLEEQSFVSRIESMTGQTIDFLTGSSFMLKEELTDRIVRGVFGIEFETDARGKIHITGCSDLKSYLRWFGEHAEKYWIERLGFPRL